MLGKILGFLVGSEDFLGDIVTLNLIVYFVEGLLQIPKGFKNLW